MLVTSLIPLALPATADAKKPLPYPARPHGARVAVVGAHSVTVTLPRLKHATRYRLYVTTRRSDLAVSRIVRAHRSPAGATPRLTVGSLPYTTAPYYYRLRSYNHTKSRYGTAIGSFRLRPATPTSVHLASSTHGTYVTWNASGTYQHTEVVQATNAAMTAGRRSFTVHGTTGQFTPYGITAGRTYWYRVRIVASGVPSAWSAQVHTVVRSRLQALRLLTYNVLTSRADGTDTTGETIAPWSQRRAGVVSLIKSATPDIVCLQEAGGWADGVQGYGGTRQVDDIVAALPGYALARTETPPSEHYYFRTGNYVLYRTAAYRTIATGGYWDIGDTRTAAYQLLQNRQTGARLLAVSAHPNFGAGRAADDQRARETRTLLSLAGAMSRKAGVPVVYAGDFNSVVNRNHVYDGPGDVMRAARIENAQLVAQSETNSAYNSANLYLRTPPRAGQSIDYVFAPPGVAVGSRSLLLHLVGGHFSGVIPSDHNPLLVTAAFPY